MSESPRNRLADEQSPYLLQHKDNPVHWQPWDESAFRRAREENKPIFLSIGYSTCHWCHVMEHESFENQEVAAILNADFISIKVDREERPDVDRLYMSFVQATTGQGGWPLSVWLTPDLKPFAGGTYFPPEDRYGRPGFQSVLGKIAGQLETMGYAVPRMEAALIWLRTPPRQVVLSGGSESPGVSSLRQVLADYYDPFRVVAYGLRPQDIPEPEAKWRALSLFHSDHPAAAVCRDFTCLEPVQTPDQLKEQLEEKVE